MHCLSTCALLITLLIAISVHSAPSTKPLVNDYRLCPEEYRKLRRRQDETSSELDGDDDSDVDESRENVCEQAMNLIIRHRNIATLNPAIFLTYCPHYNERLALVRGNNNTLCEIKKQARHIKQKRQAVKRRRDDDASDSDDDNDDDKRRALRRRELEKRLALRFIRKRMSSNLKI